MRRLTLLLLSAAGFAVVVAAASATGPGPSDRSAAARPRSDARGATPEPGDGKLVPVEGKAPSRFRPTFLPPGFSLAHEVGPGPTARSERFEIRYADERDGVIVVVTYLRGPAPGHDLSMFVAGDAAPASVRGRPALATAQGGAGGRVVWQERPDRVVLVLGRGVPFDDVMLVADSVEEE